MQESKTGRWWKRGIFFFLSVLAVLLGAVILAAWLGTGYLVDIFWYDALGYRSYYFLRTFYRYAVFLATGAFFFVLFGFNFWLAVRLSRQPRIGAEPAQDSSSEQFSDRRQGAYLLLFLGFCLALSLLVSWPAYANWGKFLFFVFGPAAGLQDPYYGRDVSFYLFRYPVYTLLLNRLRIACGALLIGTFLVYAANGALTARRRFAAAGKWHLGVLAALVAGIEIWAGALQLLGLVYDHSNFPTFDGPGYVQMVVTRPLIWTTMILVAGLAVALGVAVSSRRAKVVSAVIALLLGVVLTLRGTDFLERLVAEYVVKPNQLSKEAPYIAANIKATLDAYGLNAIENRDFHYQRFPENEPLPHVQEVLDNIPLWNESTLETVFHQLQELRTYYAFPPVSVGRYTVEGRYQQVFLAPREIDYPGLPDSAKNWINRHLTYTHGIGTVMVPASQEGESPMTWLISGIPPQSDFGLDTAQPRIYYGMEAYSYVIAPNSSGELDYPLGESNVTGAYDGRGGVPVGSLFKKLLYAYYYKTKEIFFTTSTTAQSKILYHRNIIERVSRIAPFLRLDGTPYAVQTPRGIFWFIDAYTSSDFYPGSAPFRVPGANFNYLRNSVKIVVDAYHGSVDFYVFDEDDPIVRTYRRIYPGLFKSKERMPADLLHHVRYPRDIFNIQMRIYARYHQTDPAVFYNQEDLWTFADTVRGGEVIPVQPYYLTVNLMQEDRLDFLLLLPMMPKDRNNLRSLALAASDEPHYGRIVIYNFPKGELVYGPAQINAIINQEPQISEMFTLWDQSGSAVQRGEMIILPFGGSVLFIQPVYLISRSDIHIPELQRVIMSEGQVAVIDTTLEAAYAKLREKVGRERERQHRRPPAPASTPDAAPQ